MNKKTSYILSTVVILLIIFIGTNGLFALESITVDSPNGDETLVVSRTYTISWTWTGTIDFVTLYYSPDNFTVVTNTITSTAIANTGSYEWTIPNDISPDFRFRVKVADASNPTVCDVSDNPFKIRADIIVTKPIGGERWITNETQTITWVITGTVPSVTIYYSIDAVTDTFNSPRLVISETANTGYYYWKIPDEWNSPPNTTPKANSRVMVCDSRDLASYGRSPNTFRIDYYYITFIVRDSITRQDMRALTFMDPTRGWSQYPVSSPKTWGYPYGTYTTIISKTGYLEEAVEEWVADRDKTFTLYMESSVVHNWQVMVDFNYNPINDNLFITSWFMRDGLIMYNPPPDSVRIDIYDQVGNFVKSLQSSSADIEGVFRIPWENTGLQSNTTYWAKTELIYSGVPFRSALTLEIESGVIQTYQVMAYFNFNDSAKRLESTSWLMLDGLMIPEPESITIDIHDQAGVLTKTLISSTHDTDGIFRINWDNPNLDPNQTYLAYITIVYDGKSVKNIIAYHLSTGCGEEIQSGSSGSGEGKKFLPCFIATAAYGSPLAKPVMLLKQFRDRYLITSGIGQRALSVYYKYSPQLAGYISKHPVVKTFTQIILLPVIIYAWFMVTTGLVVKILTSGLIILLGIILIRRSSKFC